MLIGFFLYIIRIILCLLFRLNRFPLGFIICRLVICSDLLNLLLFNRGFFFVRNDFFLLIINITYALFDTFGIIDTLVKGEPGNNPMTLVYKVYVDGFRGNDMGGSSAQSVVLMVLVLALTVVQFRLVERRIHYT